MSRGQKKEIQFKLDKRSRSTRIFHNCEFKYALTDEVGLADGCLVGPGVGDALGAFVGDKLGALVTGFLLGCPDVTVGMLVGLGDGAAVVGTGVGPGDGAFVGLDVGACE